MVCAWLSRNVAEWVLDEVIYYRCLSYSNNTKWNVYWRMKILEFINHMHDEE